jgi:hypothetical protein
MAFSGSDMRSIMNAVEKATQPKTITEELEINEGSGDYNNSRRARGWAILPATMELYGNRVVDIITAGSEWDHSSVIVCSKEDGTKRRLLFVVSAGGGEYPIGAEYEAFHDQTGGSKGFYRVENVVKLKDGQIVSKVNDIGLDRKASVSVFK